MEIKTRVLTNPQNLEPSRRETARKNIAAIGKIKVSPNTHLAPPEGSDELDLSAHSVPTPDVSGKILKSSADGKYSWETPYDIEQVPADWDQVDRTKPDYIKNKPGLYRGATDEHPGVSGFVPAALSDERDLFLKGDGTWGKPDITPGDGKLYIALGNNQPTDTGFSANSDNNVIVAIPEAASETAHEAAHGGLMTTADKTKLDEIDLGITPGTGADSDKVNIQLKNNVSANVLTAHQDVSGKAEKSEMAISTVSGDETKKKITLKQGLEQEVIIAHQDVSGKAEKSEMSVADVTGDNTKKNIQLKDGLSQEVVIAHQDISGKANKVTGATSGNFAGLDSNGNLVDSGEKAANFASAAQGTKADSAVQSVKMSSSSGTELKDGTSVVIPEATQNAPGVMSTSDKTKLDGIETGANKYIHPSHTAHNSGMYKVTIDAQGHVSSVAAIEKSDITALGIPAQDTTYNFADDYNGTTNKGATEATVRNAVSNAINALNKTENSTGGTNIEIQIVEENGLIKEIKVVTDNTVTATDVNTAIETALANYGGFKVVQLTSDTPPVPDVQNPSEKYIYLTKDSQSSARDPYTEWIYIKGDASANPPTQSHWEVIGETSVDLSNYIQKVSGATENNFAAFTSDGAIKDSGKNANSFATAAQGTKADHSVQTVSINNGTPIAPTNGNVNIPLASPSAAAHDDVPAVDGNPGAMSAADKAKLDSINNYIESATVSGRTMTLSPKSGPAVTFNDTGDINVIEKISVNGTQQTVTNKEVDLTIPTAANNAKITLKVDGAAAGDTTPVAGDFTVDQSLDKDIVIPAAVSASGNDPAKPGMMSSADKTKLDGIEAGAQVNVKPDWNAESGDPNEILNKPNASSSVPISDGYVANAGASTDYARADHVHADNIVVIPPILYTTLGVAANNKVEYLKAWLKYVWTNYQTGVTLQKVVVGVLLPGVNGVAYGQFYGGSGTSEDGYPRHSFFTAFFFSGSHVTYYFGTENGVFYISNGNVDNLTSTSTEYALSANQGRALNGMIAEKANDSSVVHLAGAETITGVKTFNNATSPRQVGEDFSKQSKAFACSVIKPFNEWSMTEQDNNHFRTWVIDITSIVMASTCCSIVVKLMGSYYTDPGNGVLQKVITFQVHNGNLINSQSDYTIAQSPCAEEFGISDVFKSGSNYLIQVVNHIPTANNYPLRLEIEVFNRNASAVLDNVTMTEYIMEGWPAWAGDINAVHRIQSNEKNVMLEGDAAASLNASAGGASQPVYFPSSGDNFGKPVAIPISTDPEISAVGDFLTIQAQGAYYAHKAGNAATADAVAWSNVSGKPTIPDDAGLVHKSGAETITGIKTFSGNCGPILDNAAFMCQTALLPCTSILLYNDWTAEQKDDNHYRQWEIDITSLVDTYSTQACIYLTLKSSYNAQIGHGIIKKSISFQIWQQSIATNVGEYIEANGNAAQYFRISNVIKDNNKYVIRIINSWPASNNYPILLKVDYLKTSNGTQPTLIESIIEGWPEWAGTAGARQRITCNGTDVMLKGDMSEGLNVSAGGPSQPVYFPGVGDANFGKPVPIPLVEEPAVGSGDKYLDLRARTAYYAFTAATASNATSAVFASKLDASAGGNSQPVYFPSTGNDAGKPVPIPMSTDPEVTAVGDFLAIQAQGAYYAHKAGTATSAAAAEEANTANLANRARALNIGSMGSDTYYVVVFDDEGHPFKESDGALGRLLFDASQKLLNTDITGNASSANHATSADSATSAAKLDASAGGASQPVYFPSTGNDAGKPVAIPMSTDHDVAAVGDFLAIQVQGAYYAHKAGTATSADVATKLAAGVGSDLQPVYISSQGVPTATQASSAVIDITDVTISGINTWDTATTKIIADNILVSQAGADAKRTMSITRFVIGKMYCFLLPHGLWSSTIRLCYQSGATFHGIFNGDTYTGDYCNVITYNSQPSSEHRTAVYLVRTNADTVWVIYGY